jgi:hypothetical protein
VAPEEELDQGTLIKDFAKEPSDVEIQDVIPTNAIVYPKRVKGNMLDQDVQIARY